MHAVTKCADWFPSLQISTMRICNQSCLIQFKLASLRHICLIHMHCLHFRQKHMMTSKFFDLFHSRTKTDTKDFSLPADNQNIGIQNFCQYLAYIVENDFTGIVVMQKLIDFPCLV